MALKFAISQTERSITPLFVELPFLFLLAFGIFLLSNTSPSGAFEPNVTKKDLDQEKVYSPYAGRN